MSRLLMTVAGLSLSIVVVGALANARAEQGSSLAPQDELVKSEVETAVSMLKAIYEKHQRGELTLEQAEKLGADLLRELRYGTDGYFWADTTEGVNVVLYGRRTRREGTGSRTRIRRASSM